MAVLRALWTQDGVGVRELSQRVHMAAPTTLKAIVTLEKAGLAYRTSDKNDARKTLVYLTAKGRRLFSRVVPHMDYVNRMAVKGMSKFEQEEVKRLLKHMRANMANQQESAPPKTEEETVEIASDDLFRIQGQKARARRPTDRNLGILVGNRSLEAI